MNSKSENLALGDVADATESTGCCGGPAPSAESCSDAEQGDALRQRVSEDYAKALERSHQGAEACCAVPAGTAAKLAGYGEELTEHGGAAESSFGCGNPLAFSEVKEGEIVLDLGSGAGLDLLIAAQKVGPSGKVIGVDMTDEMLAEARRNAERAGAGQVEVRKGLIEALPVEDASVDWVISNCVVNLSPEKERVFAEILRVLKPGGRFSISDIVVEDLPLELQQSAAAYSACIGGAISEQQYTAGLRTAGLDGVAVSERFVYEPEQVVALVSIDSGDLAESADSSGASSGGSCCGPADAPTEALDTRSLEGLRGKVASVRFSGRRPE